jgi:hypothetical protein
VCARHECAHTHTRTHTHTHTGTSRAGEALKANITTLGPLVLPLSEQVLFAANMVARKLFGRKAVRT